MTASNLNSARDWDRANAARLLEWGRLERRREAARHAALQERCRVNREHQREWAARLASVAPPATTPGRACPLAPALVVGLLTFPCALIFAAFLGGC